MSQSVLTNQADSSKRIKILTNSEYRDIYELPVFSDKDQSYFFSMDEYEMSYFKSAKPVVPKIFFALQLGYFKASQRFFNFTLDEVFEDVNYISKQYFEPSDTENIALSCAKNTKLKQRKQILELLDFKNYDSETEQLLIDKSAKVVKIDSNPCYIFRELCRYSQKYRFIFPAYSTAQDIISKAILDEENRVFRITQNLIDNDTKTKLRALLLKEEETRYLLTLVKSPATSFSYGDVTDEIEKKKALDDIFEQTKKIIPQLGISHQTILYFSKLIDGYTIFQIKRFSEPKQFFYILCFVYHRYRKINDNLIKTFLHLMGKYKTDVKSDVDQKILETRVEQNRNLKKLPQIIDIITDDDNTTVSTLDEFKKTIFLILSKERLKGLSGYIVRATFDTKKMNWESYDSKYAVIRRNIRQLFDNLCFSYQSSAPFYKQLFNAIDFLKTCKNRTIQIFKNAPTSFIQKQDTKFILATNSSPIPNRYEVLIYRILKSKLTTNDVFVRDSIEYQYIEDDLINKEYFEKNCDSILSSLDLLPYINMPMKEVLALKSKILEETIHRVNNRILKNQNSHFEVKEKGKWALNYEGIESETMSKDVFGQLTQIDLSDVIDFVDHHTNILSSFTHIMKKNATDTLDLICLKAVVTGLATNMGLKKMAVSSGFSLNKLKSMSSNFLREDTLKLVNEKLVNETKKLPIFEHFNVAKDTVFSSIDGQKYPVGVNAINSRHSSKYFGCGKGVSVLTMNANFQALSSRIISANEYEGHYNLELFLMNDSDIQPDYHTSDSHGANDINSALFDFFDCTLATRYANLNNKCEFIYGTKPLTDYPEDFILKPNYRVNESLILDEEKNMKWIIASLALKTTNVSTIVKKISTCPKSNQTRKAFAEFDKLIRSIYLLNYIDDLELRQYVQKALNRGELYHKLKRAVGFANGGKIMARSEYEQTICQECNRLICNIIVYYNSYLLSQLLLKKEKMGHLDEIEKLKQMTPISWAHINLYGKYVFHQSNDFQNINEIIAQLDQMRFSY
jgi:TnpA family transposase